MIDKSKLAEGRLIRTRDGRALSLGIERPMASSSISVKTTGVYCRPSCAAACKAGKCQVSPKLAKTPRRRAFVPASDASRMSPRSSSSARRRLRTSAGPLRPPKRSRASMRWRARRAQRLSFSSGLKAATGVTPRAYAVAERAKRVRDGLAKRDATVTAAIYEAGFNSNGRFYETSDRMLGMTPPNIELGAPTPKYASQSANARSDPSLWREASGAFAPFSWAMIQTRSRWTCKTVFHMRA